MLKINLTNEIYSKQIPTKPGVFKVFDELGRNQTIIEYVLYWWYRTGPNKTLKAENKPIWTDSTSFKWFRKFINRDSTNLNYICLQRSTQILKPKGE